MGIDNDKIDVKNISFNKEVVVPSSKSYANRVIILGSICKETVVIKNLPLSHDVSNLIKSLRNVGVDIIDIENGIQINNSFPECELNKTEAIKIYPGDGGTTTRFLIPFLSLGKNEYQIEPEGRMRSRPILDLLSTLKGIGANIDQSNNWLTISGPIHCKQGEIIADASKTTQHATGLALSLCFQDVEVIPEGMEYSTSYWEMTKSLMNEFKQGTRVFTVPVDFSSMSYVLALGADLGSVVVKNCTYVDKYQADSIFISILKKMGCDISISSNGLNLNRSKALKPIEFDCSDCPDLVPTLAFMCSRTEGVSRLKNLSVLKYKESDRLHEIQKLLDLYKIQYCYDQETDHLEIFGNEYRSSVVISIDPPDDHRIVMTSYLFLRANGGGVLSSIKSVKKSFSNFFKVVSTDSV